MSQEKSKKSKEPGSSSDLDSDSEDEPVMVLDEVTSDTEIKTKTVREAIDVNTVQLSPPAPIENDDIGQLRVQPSRIMNKSTGTVFNAPKSRVRINPLKQKCKYPNQNVPVEASASNIDEQPASALHVIDNVLDPETIFNQQVHEEFAPDNIAQLVTICDVESFLLPLTGQQTVKSFLDREVDVHKIISYMVGHMNAYYDLSTDQDPFSERRQVMDDQLWDNLAYLIPLLCRQVVKVLEKEPLIVTIEPDALIFGDLHGNFNDLHHIYKHLISNKLYGQYRIVFLGDYVDRGPKSIEIVCLLFALKLTNPSRFVLLRGNHEVLKVNRKYGFESLCEHIFEDSYLKFPIMAKLIYQSFNRAFAHLPLGALIKSNQIRSSIFCCHGGIPNQQLKATARGTAWKIEELNALTGTMKPSVLAPSRHVPSPHLALNELLWNDPIPDKIKHEPRFQTKQFYPNKKRGGHCSYFTENGLKAFLESNDLAMLVRGHQFRPCKRHGFAYAFDKHMLTLFSGSNYCGTEHNTTGYALVTGHSCKVVPRVLRTAEDSSKFKEFNIFRIAIDEKTKKITEVVY